MNILTIAYTTEGSTDQRFLEAIIFRVFEEIAFGCDGMIEIYDPVFIKFPKKDTFVNDVIDVSIEAAEKGMNVLCVQVDADNNSQNEVLENKIDPAFQAVSENESSNCKNLVAIIPIHMTEAWMLADKDLLKREIGTDLSNTDLGINRAPESIADPKKIIEDALNIAQSHISKRRNKINIGDLYQPMGQKLSMSKLESLDSFISFKKSVENSFKQLNFLQ